MDIFYVIYHQNYTINDDQPIYTCLSYKISCEKVYPVYLEYGLSFLVL